MATPFPFGSGNTLLASQLNAITTLPVSTKTASYVLTVADVGYRIVMNSASATTITVNTSIFGASDVVEILNIGAGVCTVTAGTCTVGTSGTLALVQNAGGTLTFISASASVFRATAVAASASGLVPITPTSVAVGSGTGSSSGNGLVTFAGVSSVSLNGVFSATYNNYRILLTPTTASTTGINVTARLRQSGSDITTASSYVTESLYATDAVAAGSNDVTTLWYIIDSYNTTYQQYASATMDLFKPFNATIKTMITNCHFNTGTGTRTAQRSGTQSGTATCDGITITASTGTIGGTISVYGYSL